MEMVVDASQDGTGGLFPKTEVVPLPGSLHAESRRCGKPSCRCASGEPHGPYFYRRWREGTRQRKEYVPQHRLTAVQAGIAQWQQEHPPAWSERQELSALEQVEERHTGMPSDGAIDSGSDLETKLAVARAEDARRVERLRSNALSVHKAMEGWANVDGPEAWAALCTASGADYRSGRFLLERLGAERHLDPPLMATLWGLRQALLEESGAGTVAEAMVVDLAVLGFYHTMRIQGWIGDLALLIEHELFLQDAPSVRMKVRYGPEAVDGLEVEERLRRLGEQLLPLLDRANRMVLRNLKVLQELRRGPMPAVAIGRADQVNVAHQQVNSITADGRLPTCGTRPPRDLARPIRRGPPRTEGSALTGEAQGPENDE